VVAEDEIVEVDGPNGSKINATKTALLCGGYNNKSFIVRMQ
jgi:hypothetical protein